MSSKSSTRTAVSSSRKDRLNLCTYTFADGRCCRTPRHAAPSPYCFFHARKLAQARAAEELGRDIAAQFSGAYLSANDLSFALGRLFAAAAQGHIKPKAAATLAYLGQVLLQSIRLSQDEFISAFGSDFWRTQIRASFAQATRVPLNPPTKPSAPEPAAPTAGAPPPPQPQPAPQPPPQPQPASTLPCRAVLSADSSAVALAEEEALAKVEASAEAGAAQTSSPPATAPPSPQPKEPLSATQTSQPTITDPPSSTPASPTNQPSPTKNKKDAPAMPAKNETSSSTKPSPQPGSDPQRATPEPRLPGVETGPPDTPDPDFVSLVKVRRKFLRYE